MKVELLVSRGGIGFVQNAGEVIDVSDEDGKRMIEAGQCIPVRSLKRERTTSRTRTEKAAK